MEKRRAARMDVGGQANSKMGLVENLDIVDLGMTGIRSTCLRHMTPRTLKNP